MAEQKRGTKQSSSDEPGAATINAPDDPPAATIAETHFATDTNAAGIGCAEAVPGSQKVVAEEKSELGVRRRGSSEGSADTSGTAVKKRPKHGSPDAAKTGQQAPCRIDSPVPTKSRLGDGKASWENRLD
jgi:hypothetical protein